MQEEPDANGQSPIEVRKVKSFSSFCGKQILSDLIFSLNLVQETDATNGQKGKQFQRGKLLRQNSTKHTWKNSRSLDSQVI